MTPINEVLEPLKQALCARDAVVLIAPPGAGKTTVAPLALLDEPWLEGRRIIMLEPRRLAARAAATRMAATLGEAVGERVGFRVRMQAAISARTRIEVVTEGVFTRMILDDPGLEGVGLVIFDEFHERSLDADLGLALARDVQTVLRADLRLLVMSATLEGGRIAARLNDAPVIESLGRSFPVETRYLGRDPGLSLEEQAVKAVRTALVQAPGGVLVFLPGQREIMRAAEILKGSSPPAVLVAPLYGALSPEAQDQAMAPPPPGVRKVVLASAIAESSLTLEGVSAVVDAGFARVPRFDPVSGLTRLQTQRVSRAAADQRRGRAGRTSPGLCYRLWDEQETRSLPPYPRPEILDSDLSGLVLDLSLWGVSDPATLVFLDPPPKGALEEAAGLLRTLGALDDAGHATPYARRLSSLALPPRLAHMVLEGVALGRGRRAAIIAAILTERGLGGASADVHDRVAGFLRETGARAKAAATLAARWARQAGAPEKDEGEASDGRLLMAAYPDRVARRLGEEGRFRLASGRGAFVDAAEPLARAPFLIAAELAGGGPRDRILLGAAVSQAEVMAALSHRMTTGQVVAVAPTGAVSVKAVRRLGSLVMEERVLDAGPERLHAALLDQVRRAGLDALPLTAEAKAFRDRVAFLRTLEGDRWPDFSDAALLADLDAWLGPILQGVRSLKSLSAEDVEAALWGRLGWDLRGRLDKLAPRRFQTPTGSSIAIDYAAEGGPSAEVRVQEVFGLNVHPRLAEDRVALTLALTSPAHRPLQVTKDLPGFWRGSWADVRREMRGRYPRHPWPEDPANAVPTRRAKPRGT